MELVNHQKKFCSLEEFRQDKKKYLSVSELSQLISVKESWLRSQVFHGRIPYIKIGALVRFDIDDVAQWIEKNKIRPGQGPPSR